MEISNFCKWVKIDEKQYAIFNTLLMDILYVTEDEFNSIMKFDVDSEDEKILTEYGIYIDCSEKDKKALKVITDICDKKVGVAEILYLVLTQGCNLGCKYCFLENESGNWKQKVMKDEIITMTINKFADYVRLHKVSSPQILLFGGEPTINWQGLELAVKLVKEKIPNAEISIVTNGTLITPSKAKFIKENDIGVGISIDGPKGINDTNRIYKHAERSVYDRVMYSIKILKEYGCKFGLSITVSDAILNAQDEVIEWLKGLEISGIYFNLYHYTKNEMWKERSNKTIAFLIKAQLALKEKGIYDGRIQRQIESVCNKEFKFSDCGAVGLNQIVVKPDGDVLVCQCDYSAKDNYLGNIVSDSIDDILGSPNSESWKRKLPIFNDKCLKCECLYICGGGCLTQSRNVFETTTDEAFCNYTKTILKWILKTGM